MNALRSRPVDLEQLNRDWLASRLPHDAWQDVDDLIGAVNYLWHLHESDDEQPEFAEKLALSDLEEAAGRVLGRLLDASEAVR